MRCPPELPTCVAFTGTGNTCKVPYGALVCASVRHFLFHSGGLQIYKIANRCAFIFYCTICQLKIKVQVHVVKVALTVFEAYPSETKNGAMQKKKL